MHAGELSEQGKRGSLEKLMCFDLCREGHYKMIGGVLPVRPSVCRVPRPNSRTERPRKPITRVTRELRDQKVKGQG